jgi:undecaprenyl-diphosphatase
VLLSAVAAAILTTVVRRSELLAGEVGAMRWVDDHSPSGVDRVAAALDVAFTEYAAPVVFAALVVFVWRRWGTRPAVLFLVAGSLTAVTKVSDLASRPRPTSELEWTTVVYGEGGYPSGHVVFAVVVFGFLLHLARRHEPPGAVRTALSVGLTVLIVASGPARLVEADHWPADVVAGYLLAFPLLAGAVWLDRRMVPAPSVEARVAVSCAAGP